MTKTDAACLALCGVWLTWMAMLPAVAGLQINITGDVLNAVVTGIAILFSTAAAIGVPLVLRRVEAVDARQDALDAAMDLARWTFAAVKAINHYGIMPPRLDEAVWLQIIIAEERVRSTQLLPLRSSAISRRVRHIQRIGRALVSEARARPSTDQEFIDFVGRTAEQFVTDILPLARLVEHRPHTTSAEIRARLDLL